MMKRLLFQAQNELNEFPKRGYVYVLIFSESEPFTEEQACDV